MGPRWRRLCSSSYVWWVLFGPKVGPDRCGCCQVCARREGELCDDKATFGTCGDNLECQYQPEAEESICVCRQTQEICGSDGITYDTPCQNEESVKRGSSPK